MTLTEENGLRILKPDNLDNVITDVENETMRAEILYLGSSDSIDNYKEINKNTPIILLASLPDSDVKAALTAYLPYRHISGRTVKENK